MGVPTCVSCLLGALLLVGCDDVDPEDASTPVTAVRLPDDLCAVVPASAVTRWRLRRRRSH